MLNLIVLNEETTSDLKLHASLNQLIIQNLLFALMSMESKFLDILQIKP